MKPLAVDLCCGKGGWARGLLSAGYDVLGVDIEPQPEYPGRFMQADVNALPDDFARGARLVVGSPDCRGFSLAAARWKRDRPNAADFELVASVFRIARASGAPWYAVENVRGALRHWRPLYGEPAVRWFPWYIWGRVPPFALPPERAYKWNAGRYGGKSYGDSSMVPAELARRLGVAALEVTPLAA